jgi:hypothetical protein
MGRTFRVWTHLSGLRRRGQAHDIDNVIKGRRKHSLAIPCPACPEVHVNVDLERLSKLKRTKRRFCGFRNYNYDLILHSRHKHTLFISADGNFRLQRKHKRDDPDDVALNDGRSYFVESTSFKSYLTLVGEAPKEVCHCNCFP